MDLDLTSDQQVLMSSADRLLSRYRDIRAGDKAYAESLELEQELSDGGYFEVGGFEGTGPLDAVLLVERVAQVPYAVEIAASTIVAPAIGAIGFQRPFALAAASNAPVRFLSNRGTALMIADDAVRAVDLSGCTIEPVSNTFAYPFARFVDLDIQTFPIFDGVSPEQLRQWWQVALAAEIGAVARKTVELTVAFVTERRQFNRAIGSYQAVQHRLAECSTLVSAIQLLSRQAAATGDPSQAAMAACYAQGAIGRIIYDTQQFHGATGVTLEYPLHLWSYRLRALQGELGGFAAQADTMALWNR